MNTIPINVKFIIETLEANGHEAFIVGGAVRDYYLGRPVNDWDITTNAHPDAVEKLFDKTYTVGKAFGTVVVVLDHHPYEVTTYRMESHYTDGRRPDTVHYSKRLEDDLSRRDFTMNAMVMTKDGEVIDYYDGKYCLNLKVIHTVGDPLMRFKEDYLRVYRYVRLNTELDFNRNIQLDAIIQDLPMNKNISLERIRVEFNKILLSDQPSKGIRHLKDLGLLTHILPGIEKTYNFDQHSKYHYLNVFDHLMLVLDSTKPELCVRLAGLLHDIGKPDTFELVDGEGHFYKHHQVSTDMTATILRRLKYSNNIINTVTNLIHYHMTMVDVHYKKSVKKFINRIGKEHLEDFLELRKADILGSVTNDDIWSVDEMRAAFQEVLNENHPMTIKDLDINGYDLMSLGYKGPQIGTIKKKLLEHVLHHHDDNKREILIKLAKKL